jgi:hypothetical protein
MKMQVQQNVTRSLTGRHWADRVTKTPLISAQDERRTGAPKHGIQSDQFERIKTRSGSELPQPPNAYLVSQAPLQSRANASADFSPKDGSTVAKWA